VSAFAIKYENWIFRCNEKSVKQLIAYFENPCFRKYYASSRLNFLIPNRSPMAPVQRLAHCNRLLGGTAALTNRAMAGACLSSGRLEPLNRITVGIFHLNLFAARTDLHLIAEARSQALADGHPAWAERQMSQDR